MERTLGPRNLGDLLGETFTIYKNNFWRLAAIISIVAIPAGIIGLIFNLLAPANGEMTPELMMTSIIIILILIPFALASALAYILMFGAVIHGVSQQYFNQPISIGRAYSFAWRRFGAMLGAYLLVVLALLGIGLVGGLLAGIIAIIGRASDWLIALVIIFALFSIAVASVYFMTKWIFIWQTALLEGCGPTAAPTHSSALVSQSWWRVFGIILLFYVIISAITMIFYAPAMVGYMTWTFSGIATGAIPEATVQPPAWLLIAITIGALIGNIVATPIFAIGETLLYFDLRVRKEGYNLDFLANELGLSSAPVDTGSSPPE